MVARGRGGAAPGKRSWNQEKRGGVGFIEKISKSEVFK